MYPKKTGNNQHGYANSTPFSVTTKSNKKQGKIDFFEEFSTETDIFSEIQEYPDWVFDFREEQLSKLSQTNKKLCRNLKSLKIGFKIKYPVKIFDKWKFADIYIPKYNTVVLVLSSYKEFKKIAHQSSDRANFFKDKFKVIELYEYNASDIEVLKTALKLQ